jgi:hypothetical protein
MPIRREGSEAGFAAHPIGPAEKGRRAGYARAGSGAGK